MRSFAPRTGTAFVLGRTVLVQGDSVQVPLGGLPPLLEGNLALFRMGFSLAVMGYQDLYDVPADLSFLRHRGNDVEGRPAVKVDSRYR